METSLSQQLSPAAPKCSIFIFAVPYSRHLHHFLPSFSIFVHILLFGFNLFNISSAVHHRLARLRPSAAFHQQVDQHGEDWESLEKVRLPLSLNLSQCMLELKQYQEVVELNSRLLKTHRGKICWREKSQRVCHIWQEAENKKSYLIQK